MFTPEVQSAGSGGGRTTPDGEVGGPHVRNNARGMGVGIDEFVWGGNHFLSWHGCRVQRPRCSVTEVVTEHLPATRTALLFSFKVGTDTTDTRSTRASTTKLPRRSLVATMTADRRADRRLARVHASPYSQKTRNAKPSQQPKKSVRDPTLSFPHY